MLRRFHAKRKDARRRALLERHGLRAHGLGEVWWAGSGSGTWPLLVGQPLGPRSVVYSVGIGTNIAWDLAVIQRFGCTVHALDPTEGALAFVDREREAGRLPDGLMVQRLGLATTDGTQAFIRPSGAKEVNWRVQRHHQPQPDSACVLPVTRWSTLTRTASHPTVDVLKLDIEGAELAVLPDILATGPLPTQLLVEFHHDLPGGRRRSGIEFRDTHGAIARLFDAGYTLFAISPRGLEMGFVLGDGGALVSGA